MKTIKKIKILLIEDDEMIILPLKIALERLKSQLLIVKDGEAGLEMIKKENPDLILLDLVLPKISGFEILEKTGKDFLKNHPVIILSNLAREGEINRGLSLGAKDYIVKTSLSIDKLVEKIRSYIG